MFDNLRDSAESSFYEEEPNDLYREPVPTPTSAPRRRATTMSNGRFLGMTAQQQIPDLRHVVVHRLHHRHAGDVCSGKNVAVLRVHYQQFNLRRVQWYYWTLFIGSLSGSTSGIWYFSLIFSMIGKIPGHQSQSLPKSSTSFMLFSMWSR